MAFFSVLGQVFQKRAVRISYISWRSGCLSSATKTLAHPYYGSKYMSTFVPKISPGLMLPPDFEGGNMVYKHYSLAEKRVLTIGGGGGGGEESELVGSSHGWVALLNRRNNGLFLSNPLSGRQIRLPRTEILGDPEDKLSVSVLKLILSSSPDEQGCRAMMTYGLGGGGSSRSGRVAFCSPGRSWRWTEISNMNYLCSDFTFDDMVYCKGVLTCITSIDMDSEFIMNERFQDECVIVNWDIEKPVMDDWNMGKPEIEYWDLCCPPKSVWEVEEKIPLRLRGCRNKQGKTRSWVAETMKQQQQCIQIPHLVYAQQSDQLYFVIRFLVFEGGPTVGFVVLKANKRTGVYEVVDDLNGQVMFVGINHSFVVSASDFPDLTSNSIYFTHANNCVNDTGIFDYEHKTITPIISGNHSSPPIWFYS